MGDINPSIFQFHRAFYTRQRMMIMTREISREMTLRRKKKKKKKDINRTTEKLL